MQIDVIKIGNSKGIRFPAYILKECNIKDKIEIEVVDGKIIIKAIEKPRANWDAAFIKMHQNGDDELIIDDNLSLNSEEWEWS
jgi:antitoxin MazE